MMNIFKNFKNFIEKKRGWGKKKQVKQENRPSVSLMHILGKFKNRMKDKRGGEKCGKRNVPVPGFRRNVPVPHKRMMKRFMAMVLSVVLVIGMIPVGVLELLLGGQELAPVEASASVTPPSLPEAEITTNVYKPGDNIDVTVDYGEPVNVNLPLDRVPNAAAAYGLRKLRTGYTGPAVRVRIGTSPNETFMDIGFVNGELDVATLLNFVGSGDAFVHTWYDQSGNGRHATQTTPANQPQIVSSGAILLAGSKSAFKFDGEGDFLNTGNWNVSNAFALISVANVVDASTSPHIISKYYTSGEATNVFALDVTTDSKASFSMHQSNNTTLFTRAGDTISLNTVNSFSAVADGFNRKVYVNGILKAGSTYDGTVNTSARDVLIGKTRIEDGYGYMNGYIPEIIVYASNITDPNRTAIERNQLQYFGINQPEAALRPIDKVTTAAAAYGLRKLRSSYDGFAIRVRRDSDNREQDIGFDKNGVLNVAALKSFVGNNSGFVSIWYDQSGKSENIWKTDKAHQPQIIDSGILQLFESLESDLPAPGEEIMPTAAYGLRKLTAYYNGHAIRVRRDDNTEKDIGFDAMGDLNTKALLDFVGSGNGFVSIWYDQSGNENDITHVTQPVIVSNGIIQMQNGRPNVVYSSASNFMNSPLDSGVFVGGVTYDETKYTVNGNLQEIIIYSTGLSSVNRTAIEASQMAYFGINQPSPTARPLDAVGSAAAAYGLRKLSSNYTGNAITVRRSSDDETMDIGFDESGMLEVNEMLEFIGASRPLDHVRNAEAAYGLRKLNSSYQGFAVRVLNDENEQVDIGFNRMDAIDTGELLAFAKGGNVRVKTWYDQSGKGRDATQEEAEHQPLIAIEGRLVTQNNRPSVSFSSSRQNFLNYDGSFLSNTPYSVFMTEARGNDKNSNWVLGGSVADQNKNLSIGYYEGKAFLSNYNNSLPTELLTFEGQTLVQSSYRASATARNIYRNGISAASGEGTSLLIENNGAMIGKRVSNITSYFDGNISEIILYPKYLDDTQRKTVEASQGRYFGVGDMADAFVAKWYDQSGNEGHAVQNTTANQPQIVNDGVVEMVNGRPAIYGNRNILLVSGGIGIVEEQDRTAFTVFNYNKHVNNNELFGIRSGEMIDFGTWDARYNRIRIRSDGSIFSAQGSVPFGTNQISVQHNNEASKTYAWRQGTNIINTTADYFNWDATNNFGILGTTYKGREFLGHISELIIYPTALSDTQRQALEASQMHYFNIHRTKETEPYITLNVNGSPRQATYLRGSGSQQITFRYTVQPGDHSITEVMLEDEVTFNNSTFKNNAGVDLSIWLGDMIENSNIFIDSGFQVPFPAVEEISNLTLALDPETGSVLVRFDSKGALVETEYLLEIYRSGSTTTVDPPDGVIGEITFSITDQYQITLKK